MAFSFEKRGAVGMLTCEGGLDADRAQTLRDALMICIENADHVVVNCGGVNTIDSQCIQIFCTAHRMAVRAYKKLMITDIAPDLKPSPQEISDLCLSRSAIGCNMTCIWTPTEAQTEPPTEAQTEPPTVGRTEPPTVGALGTG